MLHYNFSKINSYNCPLRIVLSRRGLGKTFGAVSIAIKEFILKDKLFVYVVENLEMVKTLSQDKGCKFFNSIIDVYSRSNCKKEKICYEKLSKKSEVTEGDTLNKIQGGTIKIGGETAGYIVAISDFANLKRNNFTNVKYIIIDEFIPEIVSMRNFKNSRKVVSLLQSVARINNIIIYMLANTIRINDELLLGFGLSNLKNGEFRLIRDKFGVLGVCHLVDNSDYSEFDNVQEKSVAGRIASFLNEDNLDKNIFKNEISSDLKLPKDLKSSNLLCCIHYENLSIRVNITKDYKEYYCVEDYGINKFKRICLNKKYISPNVRYIPEYKDLLINKYQKGLIFFQNTNIYEKFKLILDLN